jgi:hypothetical protein
MTRGIGLEVVQAKLIAPSRGTRDKNKTSNTREEDIESALKSQSNG